MKVISCDCFENIRKEMEKTVGYQLYSLEHIYCIPVFDDKRKEKTMLSPSDMNLPPITTCPFCGEKIEVENEINYEKDMTLNK